MSEKKAKTFRFDADPAIEALGKMERRVTSGLEQGAKKATALVAGAAKRKIKLARKTNVQDTPRRRALRQRLPVRSLVKGETGYVELRPYQTGARTKPLQGLYKRFGLLKQLERKGLWIAPRGGKIKATKAGYETRQGLIFVRFNQDQGLRDWASRRDRGYHLVRNTVRLVDPRVRLEMTLKPAVANTLGQVAKTYEVLIRKEVEGNS